MPRPLGSIASAPQQRAPQPGPTVLLWKPPPEVRHTGKMTIEGLGDFEVLDVTKVGKSVLHLVDKDIPDDLDIVGRKVVGQVNLERRL